MDPFFDDIRNAATRLPDGSPLPAEMFELTREETVMSPSVRDLLSVYPGSKMAGRKISSSGEMARSESYMLEAEDNGKCAAIMPAEEAVPAADGEIKKAIAGNPKGTTGEST